MDVNVIEDANVKRPYHKKHPTQNLNGDERLLCCLAAQTPLIFSIDPPKLPTGRSLLGALCNASPSPATVLQRRCCLEHVTQDAELRVRGTCAFVHKTGRRSGRQAVKKQAITFGGNEGDNI